MIRWTAIFQPRRLCRRSFFVMHDRTASEIDPAPALTRRGRSYRVVRWLSIVLVLASLAAALAYRSRVAAVAIVLLTLLLLGRRLRHARRPELVGPLFFYDLVRLARSGRTTLIRCVYALALLVGVSAVYYHRFPQELFGAYSGRAPKASLSDLARFGWLVVTTALVIQAAAVLVLTPAYVAGAIAEDKERRTLDLLFTTHLRDREIVLGKLCARILHLLGLLLAGLPMLCLAQLWGGVDPVILGALMLATLATLLSVAGVAILASVVSRGVQAALMGTYATVLLFNVACVCCPFYPLASPIALLLEIERQLTGAGPTGPVSLPVFAAGSPLLVIVPLAAMYLLAHGSIAIGCVWWAVQSLRLSSEPVVGQPVAPPVDSDEEPVAHEKKRKIVEETVRFFQLPPVGERPLVWLEMYAGSVWRRANPSAGDVIAQLALLFAVFLVIALTLGGLVLSCETGLEGWGSYTRSVRTELNPLVRALTLLVAGFGCAGLAYRLAGAVSRERERQTLDGLLSLPIDREELLRAKWLGNVLRWRIVAYCLGGIWLVGLLAGALHPMSALALALSVGAYAAFFACMGLWLSLSARTTRRAHAWMALALFVMFAGPWALLFVTPLSGGGATGDVSNALFEVGINPLGGWWYAARSWLEPEFSLQLVSHASPYRAVAFVAGQLVLAACAVVFWRDARNRFRNYPENSPQARLTVAISPPDRSG
jgi:ABC-type transport system involved in multi-copper enzyme maturation permease subunit